MTIVPAGSPSLIPILNALDSHEDEIEQYFIPFIDPMAPSIFRSPEKNIETAFTRLDFLSAFHDFSIRLGHKGPQSAFIATLRSALDNEEDLSAGAATGGIKRIRSSLVCSDNFHVFDIPEVRLFAHVIGDRYLDSIKETQGFDPKEFLSCFLKIISTLPEISGFQKAQYLSAISMIDEYQKLLSEIDIDKDGIKKILEKAILASQIIPTHFEDPEFLTNQYIQYYIENNPLQEISTSFSTDMYSWFCKFYEAHKDNLKVPGEISLNCHELTFNFIGNLYKKHTKNLEKFCLELKTRLQALKVTESIYLPSGFAGLHIGHFCTVSITKASASTYNIKLYNTGLGIEFHTQLQRQNKDYVHPYIEFVNVPEAILFLQNLHGQHSALMAFFENKSVISSVYNAQVHRCSLNHIFYENLFIYFRSFLNHSSSTAFKFVTPQKTGTCVYRSTKAMLVDFCNDGSVFEKVVKQIKIRTFYNAFIAMSDNYHLIKSIHFADFELLTACIKKFSDHIFKDLKSSFGSLSSKFLLLDEIHEAANFLKSATRVIQRTNPLLSSKLGYFYTSDKIDFKEFIADLRLYDDSWASSRTKFANYFMQIIDPMSLQEKIALFAKRSEQTNPLVKLAIKETLPSNIFQIFQDISLNDPSLFDDIENPITFIKNLCEVCVNEINENDTDFTKALFGKAYLLAHKLMASKYPELFKDLPISFGKYEINGYFYGIDFETPESRLISEYLYDCKSYVETFNKAALSIDNPQREKGAFLFDKILEGSFDLDPTCTKPLGPTQHPDYILYERLLSLSPELKHTLISDGLNRSSIHAIKDLYTFPANKIDNPALDWLYYLKKLKIIFETADFNLRFYKEGDDELICCESSDPVKTGKLAYKFDDLSSVFEDIPTVSFSDLSKSQLLMCILEGQHQARSHLNKLLKHQQEFQYIDELLLMASCGKTRWLTLLNWMTDIDKLKWLDDYKDVFTHILYSSYEDDPVNSIILENIKNQHFQVVFIKNIIDAILQLVSSDDVYNLGIVFLPVLSKIMPHINQGHIDFSKLNEILSYVFTDYFEESFENRSYCLSLVDILAHIDLVFCNDYSLQIAEKATKFLRDLFISTEDLDDSIGASFFKFCLINSQILNHKIEIAQRICDILCEGLALPYCKVFNLSVDEMNCHVEFKTSEGYSLFIDRNFCCFTLDDRGNYELANKILQKDCYYNYLKDSKLDTFVDTLGNLTFIYGLYHKITKCFVPALTFDNKIPLELRNLKWKLGALNDTGNRSIEPIRRNLLATVAPKSSYVLFSSQDEVDHLIALDETHSPIAAFTFKDSSFSIFCCVKQKELILPTNKNILNNFLPENKIRLYKTKQGFELEMEPHFGSEQVIVLKKTKSSFVEYEAYLHDMPQYRLSFNPAFKHIALYFKNRSDPAAPDLAFFSPKDLDIPQSTGLSMIFKVHVHEDQIMTDDLGILCNIAYMHLVDGNYEKVFVILDKLNRRNKSLYTTQKHEEQLAFWLISTLKTTYSKYTLDSSMRRYFILSLLSYFDFPDEKNKFLPILKDYIFDSNKHLKQTLPIDHVKKLAHNYKLTSLLDAVNQKDPCALLSCSIIWNPPFGKLPTSLNYCDFPIYDPTPIVLDNRVPISFLQFLKMIKDARCTKEQLFKLLLGKSKPCYQILKALIREEKIIKKLNLEDTSFVELSAVMREVESSLKDLNLHHDQIIEFPIDGHTPFKAHISALSAFSTSTTAVVTSISIAASSSSSSIQAPTIFDTGLLVKDIKNYNRFIKLFIQNQVLFTLSQNKQKVLTQSLEILRLKMIEFSNQLEQNIVVLCQNCVKQYSATDDHAHIIMISQRVFSSGSLKLSFNDLLNPYMQSNTSAYQSFLRAYNIHEIPHSSIEETKFYAALDHQIGFCLYLKILINNLEKAIKLASSKLIPDEELQSIYSLISSDTPLISIPRYQLVFEYKFGHSLTKIQKDIIEFLTESTPASSPYKLAQVIMGGGKSAVIVPLLSSIYSTNKQSCLLITPQTQLGSVLKHLDENLGSIFGQSVEYLDFRTSNLTLEYLDSILKKLQESREKKILFISSPESLQFLELELLKLLNEGHSTIVKNKTKIFYIKKLLEHFKSKTTVIIDEFSHVCDVTKQTNIPLLSDDSLSDKIPQDYIVHTQDLFLNFYNMLVEFNLSKSQVLNDWDTHMSSLVDMLVIHPTFIRDVADSKLIKDFLEDIENDEFYDDEPLCFTKYLLHFVLPHTLQKTCGRHYGRTFDEACLAKIVPYQGVGSPSTTEFGHYFEVLCYHYLTCMDTVYNKQEVAYLVRDLYERAEAEANIYKCDITITEESELFQEAFGFSISEATKIDAVNKAYAHILTIYGDGNLEPLFRLESMLVKRYVQLRESYISSNPHNLISQFSKISGFTGTPWNQDCYNLVFDSGLKFDTSIEASLDLIFTNKAKILSSSQIFNPPSKSPHDLLEFFFTHPHFSKISSFIDTGGIFSSFSNKAVAESIGNFFLRKNPALSNLHVIYFDRVGSSLNPDTPTLLIASRAPSGVTFITKPLGGLKISDLKSAGVNLEKYFVYFDERHTVGTDIPLKDEAIGIITVDKKLCHYSFLQGLMRLRKYETTQNAFVVNFDEKLKSVTDHCIFIKKLKDQQQTQLVSVVYRSYKQQIHDLVRKDLLGLILKHLEKDRVLNLSQASSLYKEFRHLFVMTETVNPSALIEEALELTDPMESLKSYASYFTSGSEASHLSHDTKANLKALLEKAESYFTQIISTPKIEFYFDKEVYLEQQIEDEVECEHENELDQDIIDEIALFNSRKSKVPAAELPFPIADVIKFYNNSKKAFKKDDFCIKSLFGFNVDLDESCPAQDYQDAFDLQVSTNAILAEDGSYLDVLSVTKRPIYSVLAVLHRKKMGSNIATFKPEIVLIGLTKSETDSCYEYLLSHPESTALLISLDREVLTTSPIELLVKEKMLESSAFIEVYAYNGLARKILELPVEMYAWINDREFGETRQRFLQIQGALQESSIHELVHKKCKDQALLHFTERKNKSEKLILESLHKEYKKAGVKPVDLDVRIIKFIKDLDIKKFAQLPLDFVSYVPLHLTRHIISKSQISNLSSMQRLVATIGQKALIPPHYYDHDDID